MRGIKIFFIVFIISLPFWYGINILAENLENVFFFEITKNNPELFTAQVYQPDQLFPKKINNSLAETESENLEISAKSAISVWVGSQKRQKVLFQKNASEKLPIASLTKIMTAFITLKNYRPEQELIITKEAIQQEEEKGNLKQGEVLSVKNLLHIILIESSNDAAYALAEGKIVGQEECIGEEKFVEMMNLKVKDLDLESTHFFNPTGVDEDKPENFSKHYSTSQDLAKLSKYILNNYPEIFEISSKTSYEVFNVDGSLHHFIPANTNELLSDSEWQRKIIGSKTGWTPEAQGCLILVFKKGHGYMINVILGSEDRFEEMKKLINWVEKNYDFIYF
ncbi:D-alanyl-D-alanine carboxypeptidase [Candidatus Parcubacteria bacterium]|nr:D-alanyl-D-alanine carboxypeptidase [Candidatus Parcubacteria bacterium]